MRPRVLYFVHGHPEFVRGGGEQASLELYEAVRASGDFEPFLAARTSDPVFKRPGTPFGALDGDPNQILFFSAFSGDDHLFQTRQDKRFYTRHLNHLLREIQPDVVHFQHTLHIGVEAIRIARAALPRVPIVYTLHEYLPICHADGQMVRTTTMDLCTHASPQRCHQCFPDVAPARFLLRERFIKAQFGLVDRFIAPSRFLLERFAAWGIPREKIIEIDYGRHHADPLPPRQLDSGDRRNRFGFFGQLTPYKGIRELLHAMRLLREQDRNDIRLDVSGANLETWPKFHQELQGLLDSEDATNVTFLGPYDRFAFAARMASVDWVVVPSIWWENSPLVIQEAFMNGRPVICSDVGGMAEKVTHGKNGLHFRVRDAADLARTLHHASDTPGLWGSLREGIPAIPSAEQAASTHTRMYRELLENRVPAGVQA